MQQNWGGFYLLSSILMGNVCISVTVCTMFYQLNRMFNHIKIRILNQDLRIRSLSCNCQWFGQELPRGSSTIRRKPPCFQGHLQDWPVETGQMSPRVSVCWKEENPDICSRGKASVFALWLLSSQSVPSGGIQSWYANSSNQKDSRLL